MFMIVKMEQMRRCGAPSNAVKMVLLQVAHICATIHPMDIDAIVRLECVLLLSPTGHDVPKKTRAINGEHAHNFARKLKEKEHR